MKKQILFKPYEATKKTIGNCIKIYDMNLFESVLTLDRKFIIMTTESDSKTFPNETYFANDWDEVKQKVKELDNDLKIIIRAIVCEDFNVLDFQVKDIAENPHDDNLYPVAYKGRLWNELECDPCFTSLYNSQDDLTDFGGVYAFNGDYVFPDGSIGEGQPEKYNSDHNWLDQEDF
jgi:hypothetical protein